MPRGRWYLKLRPTRRTPFASSAEARLSPGWPSSARPSKLKRRLRPRSIRPPSARRNGWLIRRPAPPGLPPACCPGPRGSVVSRVTTSHCRQPSGVLPVLLMGSARIGALVDIGLPGRSPGGLGLAAAGGPWHRRHRRTRCARAGRRTGRGSASRQDRHQQSAAQCQPGVGPAPFSSSSAPVSKRSRENAWFRGCGASLAIVCANTQPEAGVALKPP